MIFKTSILVGLMSLFPAVLSAPTVALGSKHNVYLVHCDYSDCLLGLICDTDSIVGAAYFRNGPITEGSTGVQRPTTLAQLSGRNPTFEGKKNTFRFGDDGTFTSNITAGANKSDKNSIAGDATLGTEPFICFRDGTTKFDIRQDTDRYTCTADYWCGSIDASSGGN
jgi:hypothetical protein